MTVERQILKNPPIIEAILDIDCELSPKFELLGALEDSASKALAESYPTKTRQFMQSHQITKEGDGVPEVRAGAPIVQSIRFHDTNNAQLVQFRNTGFSFNRLRPYTSLDDYFDEIFRTWEIYKIVAVPLKIREIRLRFINRIMIPLENGRAKLDDYFVVGPSVPDDDRFLLASFLNQFTALDNVNSTWVDVVLVAQSTEESGLPVVLDTTCRSVGPIETDDNKQILATIQALRESKNTVFWRSLTEKCLNLFQ